MKFVNRCVVTLKPRKAFIDWATGLGAELPEDWSFEGGAYLLNEQETEEALLADISQQSRKILENELSVWTEDRSQWPEPLDHRQLQSFFELYIAVAAFDLGNESLLRADISDIQVF
ncbi:hypothetical protein [Endozoicomonas sp. Mp262]|uniref:hypothetical protein n=1 Tax=Endozoicomonas sp. Mp262 TaxID=2919499 RepID=UPI0021D8314A